ncbi:MAG: hypothetical protein NVSMB14_02540 [Isosphaeraceae bacterium]
MINLKLLEDACQLRGSLAPPLGISPKQYDLWYEELLEGRELKLTHSGLFVVLENRELVLHWPIKKL